MFTCFDTIHERDRHPATAQQQEPRYEASLGYDRAAKNGGIANIVLILILTHTLLNSRIKHA